jgi:hypothetical protein
MARMKTRKQKKQVVKILGHEVTVGTKKHAELVWQLQHFNGNLRRVEQ